MDYVDVFISHQQRDESKAVALKNRIEKDLKFSCYIDVADPELAPQKDRTIAEERALAERIRRKLRGCRCIIFAHSSQALARSRWMPWELGFFDGRWGPRQIGRYDLDEPGPAPAKRGRAREADKPRMLEYLHIYEEVTPDNLHDFLRRACSTRALADRADVDGDRLATMLIGMSRDPLNFAFDAWAYLIALQQEFSRQLSGGMAGLGRPGAASPEAFWGAALQANDSLRRALQPVADMMKLPDRLRGEMEAMIAEAREGHEKAIGHSRGL